MNPQESPVTPVPNPALILRRGKPFQGQTSKSGTEGNPLFSYEKATTEKIESCSKSVDEKATVTTVEESIISYQQENAISDELIDSNLVEEPSKTLERNHSSSSLDSFH